MCAYERKKLQQVLVGGGFSRASKHQHCRLSAELRPRGLIRGGYVAFLADPVSTGWARA